MSFLDSALSFVEGIKSVIDVSGAIQGTISDAISNGVERSFRRIRRPMEQSLMKVSLVFVSVFFIVWGVALFVDNFVPYHGLGFAIVGALFGMVAILFLKENAE